MAAAILSCRSNMPLCPLGGSRATAAAALPRQRLGGLSCSRSSFSARRHSSAGQRLPPVLAAADSSGAADGTTAAADELPLWRFLRQQGFSADSIGRLQAATRTAGDRQHAYVTGTRTSEEKVQRDLAPNIAALRAEGLETASLERLFEQNPTLLTTTHATFSSSLAELRRLTALVPSDPRAVQAPPGTTRLGVAVWLYPTAAAYMLKLANLGSLIDGNLRLRQRLGISEAQTAIGLLQSRLTFVSNFERAEAMLAHLQGLQAGGALTAEQVAGLAQTSALKLTPAEFDRRWQEGGVRLENLGAMKSISYKDPAGRKRAAAEVLGELLQAADGVPGPLQPQYRQQGEALLNDNYRLVRSGHAALRANWASLQQLGLSDREIVAAVQAQPAVLTSNWEAEAKQWLLDWLQQELGLSPYDFLTRHAGYATHGVGKIAMRADFLRQHRPALWAEIYSRGTGPVLSMLTHRIFFPRADCTKAELDAFNRAWLATPAGRRWGAKPRQLQRRAVKAD